MHRRVIASVLSLIVWSAASLGACTGGDDPPLSAAPVADACAVGTEGCACTSGNVCNAGLECRSQLCVVTDASSGQDGDKSDAADADAGCLTLLKAGQDQPAGIVDTGSGLAWVNLGASPAVVFADYTGIVQKSIPAPGANGAIAFDGSFAVWADGTSVRFSLAGGLSVGTVATPGYTIGAVATTNGTAGPNAYFTQADNHVNGVHYCTLALTTCTTASTVAATVGANLSGIAGRGGILYWTNSTMGGGVHSCMESGGCPSTTDYGADPHPPIFITLSNATPFWTTFMLGTLRSQNNTIATGTPAGLYLGLATDGETIFFQAFDSASNGGIYAVKATASSAAGKFIAPAKFPQTFGVASGVTYGNKHFYWTDQTTNSIYAWDATCPF